MTAYKAFRSYYIAQAFISSQKWGEAMAVFQRSLKYSAEVMLQLSLPSSLTTLVFQAKKAPSQDASLVKELELLEKAIEGRKKLSNTDAVESTFLPFSVRVRRVRPVRHHTRKVGTHIISITRHMINIYYFNRNEGLVKEYNKRE